MKNVLRLARFELRTQLRRVVTWVYFSLFALIGFVWIAGEGGVFGGDTGDAILLVNSPRAIANLLQMLAILSVPVTAALAGNAVYRDFQTRSYPLFFTTPIRPAHYLAGRWLGAVAANLLVFLGCIPGILLATVWPTIDQGRVGPFHPLDYLVPLAVFVIPNLLFTAALFVTLTALTRRMLPTYVGGMVLLTGWSVASVFINAIDDRWLARLADPFAFSAVSLATRYWTVAELNAAPVPLDEGILLNRLLWTAVGAAVFALGAATFRFRQSADHERAPRWQPGPGDAPAAPPRVPEPHPSFGGGARLRQLIGETRRSLREVVANVWFPILISLCVGLVLTLSTQIGAIYGTRTFPVTYQVLDLVEGGFGLFSIIIVTFYAGELVWNEREHHAAGIHDSLPVPTWVPFLAKVLALIGIVIALQAAAMLTGVAIQAAYGYFNFEPWLYLRSLFVYSLVGNLLPFVFLAVVVQTLVNHKYVGHLLVILVMVGLGLVYHLAGIEHALLQYGGTPALKYSDMNGFGHVPTAWAWFALYWAGVGVLLLFVARLLWVRGQETGLLRRLRQVRRRLTPSLAVGAAAVVLLVAGTGGFIFYNTNVLNHYEPPDEGKAITAGYEKRYKRFQWVPQPRVTAARLNVDIYPDSRNLRLRGSYTLTNKTGGPIDSLHVDVLNTLRIRRLAPDRPAVRVVSDSARGYYIFRLQKPLAPGDSMRLGFDLAHEVRGFPNEPEYGPVVNNGTFFNTQYLPHIGYNAEGEMIDEGDRQKHGLPPRPRTASIDDARARTRNFVSSDADWIAFDVTVGTAAGQTAVAPGYLRRTWTQGGRRYFHYTMDAPILNFYAFLSARYNVRRDRWRNVAVEVYHHPGHGYNVGRMIGATKAALDYCTREFGPYQHRQVRILEVPRYAEFAQSFDNTIPYSEGIGFIADVRRDDIDYPFFVTAHEVAHQWWGHQVAPADVQGAAMLSETLSEYTALMVMEKRYGREKIGRFLRYELDQYLRGRGGERRAEKPLMLVENQQYIHYNKGALAMYALRDYIGEQAVNRVLRSFLDEWRFRGPPYPTSRDLVNRLRAAAPDSLKPVVDDLFTRVTLWGNRAVAGEWERIEGRNGAPDRWAVMLTVEPKKVLADSLGNETELPVNDLVDVGVYAGGRLIHNRKYRLHSGHNRMRLVVNEPPDSAGIDPEHKLIDRNLHDNVMFFTAGREERSRQRGGGGLFSPREDSSPASRPRRLPPRDTLPARTPAPPRPR
ncbi:MAG TPA: M1 family aminopeptidase [Longimicrobium sp.]|nr:M1 family aminopeptidase [Longimicrobium sp.]